MDNGKIDPTAGSAGIPALYHYEPFVPEYFISILKDRKLHCSTPANVNDPSDCKPWFDTEQIQANPILIEDTLRILRKMAKPHNLLSPLHSVYEQMARTDQKFLRKIIDGCSQQLTQILGKKRLYCLSPCPATTLMWSHYAAKHTGICLEFNVSNNLLFRLARPVHYEKTYPTFLLSEILEDVLPLMLTKAMDWWYEREYRLIGGSMPGPLRLEGDFLQLPDGALNAVIIGVECRQGDEISSIVQQFYPALQIKRAVRTPNHYELTIVPE